MYLANPIVSLMLVTEPIDNVVNVVTANIDAELHKSLCNPTME